MPANVEVKARVHDPDAMRTTAERLSGSPGEVIRQHDVFFHAAWGRLKVRILAPDRGELIHYDRMNSPRPRLSHYTIVPTTQPGDLANLLAGALGVVGVVRKTRRLFLVGQTRVHLDDVERLGQFVELEVALQEHQSAYDGFAIAHNLLAELGVQDEDLVPEAYIDLIKRQDGERKG